MPPPGMSRQWYFTIRTWKCPVSNCPLLAALLGSWGTSDPDQAQLSCHCVSTAGKPTPWGQLAGQDTSGSGPLTLPSLFSVFLQPSRMAAKGTQSPKGQVSSGFPPTPTPSLLGPVGLGHVPQAAYNRPLAPRVGPTSGFLLFLDKVHQARGPSHQFICCCHSPLSGL